MSERMKKVTYLPDVHRLLPQAPEAEQGVLGSLLLRPTEVAALMEERGVDGGHFHIPAHSIVIDAILELVAKKMPVDFITLAQLLTDRNLLDAVGGSAFVSGLWTYLPTAANASYYLDIVQEKKTLRDIIQVGTDFVARAYDEQSAVMQLVDEFQTQACAIVAPGDTAKETARPIKEGVMEAISAIEQTYRHRGKTVGLETGFHQLDRMTGGLLAGQLVVIGGRPSMGKSALLWDMALHISTTTGRPVLGFSLEMTLRELAQRFICWEANINMQRLRDGFLSQTQMDGLTPTAMRIAQLKQWIDETPGISIQEIRARARRFKGKHPDVAAIVMDYLQLGKSRTKRAQENRNLEIGEISGGLKELAKELGVPIIVAAQLNREDDGANRPPKLSNLRESGSIEQDADVAVLLHRKHYYTKDEEDEGKATAILAKQRNGPTGDIHLGFSACGRFTNPEGQHLYSNAEDHRQGGSDE